MKKKSLKLQLGKKSIASLKSVKNLDMLKGGDFTKPCYGTIGGEYFCTSDRHNTCGW